MSMKIAIDGPSGAGKSTIAKAVAKTLHCVYVDTGALYRAIGLYMNRLGVPLTDARQIALRAAQADVNFTYENGEQRVLLLGEDVTDQIRTPEVSMAASAVSAVPQVRDHLLELQRQIARRQSVVMDGRDIGTVVLPDAQVKIFLTASLEERAKRRYEELVEKGERVTFSQVLSDMKQRDTQDSSRAAAPLCQAKDAVLLDTTGFSLAQSTQAVLDIALRLVQTAEDADS